MADIEHKKTEGLPEPPPEIVIAETKTPFDWKRAVLILLGIGFSCGSITRLHGRTQ